MKRYNYIIFAATCLFLSSCQTDQTGNEITNGGSNYPEDNIVRISNSDVNIIKVKSEEEITTATLGLSIDCTSGENDTYDYNNQEWITTDGGGTWTTETSMLWESSSSINNLFAYSPYDSDFDNSIYAFSAMTDQSTAENIISSDFFTYITTDYTPGESLDLGQAIAIELKHKMVNLQINLTYGNEIADDEISGDIITVYAKTDITYTKSNDAVALKTDATINKITPYTNTDNATAQVIIAPQTIASGSSFIKFIMGNKKYYFITPEEYTFVSGNSYILDVKVGNDI